MVREGLDLLQALRKGLQEAPVRGRVADQRPGRQATDWQIKP